MPVRRERFALEYLVDFNGTAAAIRVGVPPKAAAAEACRLLRDVKVQNIIEKGKAALAARADVKQDEIVRQLRRIAFSNMENFTRAEGHTRVLDLTSCTRDDLAAVQELTEDATGGSGDGEKRLVLRTKIKLSDRVKALELLSRHLGMLHDKTEHSGRIDFGTKTDDDLREELARLSAPKG